jgi:hypothetical protein
MNDLSKYTGKGIKIAVIDDGYISELDNDGILLYNYLGHKVTNSESSIFHGKQCIEIIKTHAKNSTIISIDATDNLKHIITEETIIKSIELAIKLNVDIINFSQGLDTLSSQLDEVIKQALEEDIIICASKNSNQLLTYPADLVGVFRIEMSKEIKELLCTNNTFIVPCEKIYFEKESKYIFPIGNSFATAYMSAWCAKILEFNPLATNKSILKYYSNDSFKKNKNNNKSINIAVYNYDLKFNISNQIKYLKFDYKYFYDEYTKCFKDIITKANVMANSIDKIVHINPFNYEINKKDFRLDVAELTFGQFKNMTFAKTLETQNSKLNYINKPIIAIMGYSQNMDKFEIQLSIIKQFILNNIKTANFSYNPQIELYQGGNYLEYPEKINYPDYIYHFNNILSQYSHESDVITVTLPGTIDYKHHDNKYIGKLYQLILASINVDIIILSISNFITYEELNSKIVELTETYGATVFVYICNHSKTIDVFNEIENAEFFLITDKEISEFKEVIKTNFNNIKVFDKNLLTSNQLYNSIVEALT